jgi:phosphonate degradation associated HDIG domain protein
MPGLTTLAEIERLYAERGGLTYGEGVTQTEHAVQCAVWAEAGGARDSLVVAALLHDIGHLFFDEDAADQGIDDRHEIVGAQALRRLFNEAVRGPIALHVAAKRYLCFAEPGYFDALSPASKATLVLQGGPFDEEESMAFARLPYWREAVTLRRLDEAGKDETASARAFSDFLPVMRRVMTQGLG